MVEKIEVIKIGNSPLINREGTTYREGSIIIEMQNKISMMVSLVKSTPKNEQKKAADELVALYSSIYSKALGIDVENGMREYARAIW